MKTNTYLPSLLAVFSAACAASAWAAYPDRPIRLVISSAVGGSPDIVTRVLAQELVKQMGQQIVIDNRPGAAQTIGTEMVWLHHWLRQRGDARH